MSSAVHGVLTANQVSSVEIEPGRFGVVVTNRSLSGEIYVRIDGPDPQIGADGSYVVLGARDIPLTRQQQRQNTVTVKLRASDAIAFSVEAIG